MADELDWLEKLLASERIDKWLKIVCRPQNSLASRQAAMQQMAEATMEREAYAEEARQAGAVCRLTKVLASTGDEALLDAAADVIAACSGLLACGGKMLHCSFVMHNAEDLALKQALVKFCTKLELASAFRHKSRTIQYGTLSINIREGALGDGLGARVWVVAHTLCRELLEHPAVVAGKRVLEIGSGCGLCGIVAAKLGAKQVVLTDHEDKVLQNLRDCTASNSCAAPSCSLDTDSVASLSNASHEPTEQTTDRLQTSALCDSQPAAATEAADANTGTKAQGPAQPADQDLFDNAESCHDLDDFFKADASQTSGPHAPRGTTSWDYGNMLVRHLSWQESVAAEQAHLLSSTHNSSSSNSDGKAKQAGHVSQTPTNLASAPHVALNDEFDVVIGTDILYEEAHSQLVAAVLRHRLALHGQALICCAVRDQSIFDQFAKELDIRSMQHDIVPVEPKADDHGIVGKQHDYEGGFVLMTVKHKKMAMPFSTGEIMTK